ncbi:MAG TPA: radical SAM protein [Anaerolineaceae bacterium]|nr:radical SAM protein [Anaerolineaceae bacterium]
MDRIAKLYDRFFPTTKPLPAGIYHFLSPTGPTGPYRLHLRLEPDGAGVLIVNASTVLHLNNTAAEYAYYFVNRYTDGEVIQHFIKRYDVPAQKASDDYAQFKQRIRTLIETPDLDPVTFLDFDQKTLYAAAVLAPYRLDCALTYQVMDMAGQGVAPVDRVKRELTPDEWKVILDKSWKAGIPQVIFTGGEPTLRPDLPDLIAYTEKLGQVTGLLTNGLRLAEPDYTHTLLQNGLDHIMLVLDTESDPAWEAVRHILKEDIQTTIHLTVTEQLLPEMLPLLDYLGRLGVNYISLSVNDLALKDYLQAVRQEIAERGMKLVWDLPVPYSNFHPVALELAEHEETPQGAGKAWLYVEPDGDVLPSQGMPENVLGNLLYDPWEKIWAKH